MSTGNVTGPTEDVPGAERSRLTWVRILVAVVVLVLVFGFALPRLADYGEAWEAVQGMSTAALLLLGAAVSWNLCTYWPVIIFTLPGLRLREAVVVNQASTAVANTVPGGGALAVGVTYRMLRTWGFTAPSIANHVMATGIANTLAKLLIPVLALGAVVITREVEGSYLRLVLIGLAVLAAALAVGAMVLRAEDAATRIGRRVDRLLARFGRGQEGRAERWLLDTRDQIITTVRRTGLKIIAATVVSHVSLYLVLLVALRAVGVDGDEASWARVLAAFAFVRLLSAVPVTPGGVGVVELGYVGFLATGAAEGSEGRIAAAVLVFRAVTYVLPIIVGALAWVFYQAASTWRREPDTRGEWH